MIELNWWTWLIFGAGIIATPVLLFLAICAAYYHLTGRRIELKFGDGGHLRVGSADDDRDDDE